VIVELDQSAGATPKDLQALCEQYWLPVYRAVYRSCRSKSEAEELTQEVFARALASREGGLPSGAYLVQSARNLAIDRWRAEQRKPDVAALDEDLESNELGPEALTEADEQRRDILAALDALPERYSEVLRLRIQEGLSPLEVGELLKMSPNAIRQLQFRAVQALRMALGHSKEESPWQS
jgi:RNA polymerase sigma-70 factor, ECF subfamily